MISHDSRLARWIKVQAYKHDGKLHRQWSPAYLVSETPDYYAICSKASCVTESDGRKWITLKDSATGSNTTILRTVPFWPKVVKGSGNPKPLPTGYDCGMGLTQHTYALPASAFGHKQVFISISPASTKLSQIRSKPENDVIMDHAVVRQTTKQETIMRFGQLYICYK